MLHFLASIYSARSARGPLRCLGLLLATSLLSACSTLWSDADKAKLAGVAIARPTVDPQAYQKPDATDSPGMANSLPTATGGGLIPALMGSAIDAVVTTRQQNKFESTQAKYFADLEKELAAPPVAEVEAQLQKALGAHAFFGARMVAGGKAAFTTEILHYGLQKSPYSKGDDIVLRVRIITRITLKADDGSTLLVQPLTGVARTAKHAADIVADPGFIAANTIEAAEDLAEQLIDKPNHKLSK